MAATGGMLTLCRPSSTAPISPFPLPACTISPPPTASALHCGSAPIRSSHQSPLFLPLCANARVLHRRSSRRVLSPPWTPHSLQRTTSCSCDSRTLSSPALRSSSSTITTATSSSSSRSNPAKRCRPTAFDPLGLLRRPSCSIGSSSARSLVCRASSSNEQQQPDESGGTQVKSEGASKDEAAAAAAASGGGGDAGGSGDLVEKLASVGLLVFWAAWLFYGIMVAPDQTPYRDQYYLERLINLRPDDGFVLNAVVVDLWYMLGLWPIIYAMLLIPTSRTVRTWVPAWPFVSLSMVGGAFALLPYFALWRDGPPDTPSQEKRQGWALRILESKITSAAVLVATLSLLVGAASAPSADWIEFGEIVQGSRLFHVSTSDFLVLTLSAPFWTYNDMSVREWEPRDSWGLALLGLPILGPLVYLVLRPPLPPAPAADAGQPFDGE